MRNLSKRLGRHLSTQSMLLGVSDRHSSDVHASVRYQAKTRCTKVSCKPTSTSVTDIQQYTYTLRKVRTLHPNQSASPRSHGPLERAAHAACQFAAILTHKHAQAWRKRITYSA
jgi:hypothetical protein